MHDLTRRGFLKSTAAGVVLAERTVLGTISRAVAGEIDLDPSTIRFGHELDPIVRLIQATPRERCVEEFAQRFAGGLPYTTFLAALFLAATQTGDLHQFAQVHAAHRVAASVSPEHRLLPMFWALDRIKQGQDLARRMSELDGLPPADEADRVLVVAMESHDPDSAERAAVALVRAEGPRAAMHRLWKFAPRNLLNTLGHHPIGLANSWRTQETVGWRFPEPAIRYMSREISRFRPDKTHGHNRQRLERALPQLPMNWADGQVSTGITRSLFDLLRSGEADASCDFIVQMLTSGKATARPVWDAIHLAAAEVLFRHQEGGIVIGGNLIHAVTATNALRFGFSLRRDDRMRLEFLLQAAGVIAEGFVGSTLRAGRLRDMNLIDDLDALPADPEPANIDAVLDGVFAALPPKGENRFQESPAERTASDDASRRLFRAISGPAPAAAYQDRVRTLLVSKASADAHDLKYPVAAFEDAALASPRWRPYLLAASVHAVHGTQSRNSDALIRANGALTARGG